MTNVLRGFSVSTSQCHSLKAVTVTYKCRLPRPPPLPPRLRQLMSVVKHMVSLIYLISRVVPNRYTEA